MDRRLNISIKLTNRAISQIEEVFGIVSEYDYSYRTADLLEQLFLPDYHDYYLQNATRKGDEETKVCLLMAGDTDNPFNSGFIKKYKDKIISLEGVNIDQGSFLLTNIKLLPRSVGSESNKSIFAKIKFYPNSTIMTSAIPADLMGQIAALPNARELYQKVDKNIKDWDDYLAIIEREALSSQVEIRYMGFKQEDSLTHCVFYCEPFTSEQMPKLKKFSNERVILFYRKKNDVIDSQWEEIEDLIGTIDKIDFNKNTIKVELEPVFQELALEGGLDFPSTAQLRISKMGDLAQARNLRRGLYLLKTGQAHNPDLDMILFNSKTLGDNINKRVFLEEDNLLLKSLNEKQKIAVEGVLSAKDLYLIQGPPGTGKTTVIAEICYQNALRGKKTLIASQSNLAVDNALSRLIHNPKIRALRKGNLSRVEKEGEKYTESNVVDTWLNKTADSCSVKFEAQKKILKSLKSLESQLDKICSNYELQKELDSKITEQEKALELKAKALDGVLLLRNNLEKLLAKVEVDLLAKKKIYGFSNTNAAILKSFNKLRKLLETPGTTPLISTSLQQEFESLLDMIEKRLLHNREKQTEKSYFEQDLDSLTQIANAMAEENLEEMEKIAGLLGERNDELSQHIAAIVKGHSHKEKNLYEISLLTQTRKKIRKTLTFLETLKEEYNLKGKVVVEQDMDQESIQEKVVEFRKKVADLYNYKPHKLLVLLGLKRKWKVEIITQFEIGDSLEKTLSHRLEELEAELKSTLTKLGHDSKVLREQIAQVRESNQEALKNIEEDIASNVQRILGWKALYEEHKTRILAEVTEQAQRYQDSFSLEQKGLEKLREERNAVTEEILEFNEDFASYCDTPLSFRSIAKRKDKKAFYLEILTPTIERTAKYVEIVGDWIKRIRDKKYGDKSELRDLYINTANVIGITCVQSGNRDFTEKYPDFDVVIVDEVSKATPPELVLPLLKGKKLVLVGDHKQLPPMIGSETFAELKEQNKEESMVDSEVEDLEYMKRSLFEELFGNVSEKNKVMLDIQYRMHSSIMHTINQFYIDANNKGLICGVEDEDVKKNHQLRTHYLNEHNHLLWVDIPLHPNYSEKVTGRNSYYNETEVQVIEKILKDFNESCENLSEKKEVAVITFYSAQARLLQKELMAPNKFKNLKLRVGTVDRFQGMEREIVIVSFVRNNHEGKIGFARDPKRINVALSRAQKLLVIVGCSELFCEKNYYQEARTNYKNVLKVVDSYDGLLDARVIFN